MGGEQIQRKSRDRTFWACCRYGLFIIFLLILVMLLYLSAIGLPETLTRKIERRLQFSGMALTLQKIKLGVFEGIIATDVCCFRKGDIGLPLVEAERVVLRFAPREWFSGKNGLTGARIKNGIIRIPVQSVASATPTGAVSRVHPMVFNKVEAELRFDGPQRVRMEELTTEVAGIKVTGKGVVQLPPEAPAQAEKAGEKGAVEAVPIIKIVAKDLEWLKSIQLSNAVNADLEFFVDTVDVRKLDLSLKVDSRNTRLPKCAIGAWNVDFKIKGKTGQGDINFKDTDLLGCWIEKLACHLRYDQQTLEIERLESTLGRGAQRGPLELKLAYHWGSQEYQGQALIGFGPQALVPLMKNMDWPLIWLIEDFDFTKPLTGALDFSGHGGTNPVCQVKGSGQADNFRYEQMPVLMARSAVAVNVLGSNVVVVLDPMVMVREEGSAQGGLVIDAGAQTIGFKGTSTADPQAVAAMIHPLVRDIVKLFRFEGPVMAKAWGTIGYADPDLNDMELVFDGQRMGWNIFLADYCSFDMMLSGADVEISDLKGSIYQGRFNGKVSVYPVPVSSNMGFKVDAKVDEIDFSLLVGAISSNKAEEYQGRLSGDISLEGVAGEIASLKGKGQIKVGQGRIFQIPLFGGLSDILTKLIPGLGFVLNQTEAKAAFVVENGKVHADEILIEGDILSLKAEGDYCFDGKLDYKVQVQLMRQHTLVGDVMRLVTFPVSKMLELRLTGTLREPHWYPVYLPKEMFMIFDN